MSVSYAVLLILVMESKSELNKPQKSKAELRRERRELQESQRAAKAAKKAGNQPPAPKSEKSTSASQNPQQQKVPEDKKQPSNTPKSDAKSDDNRQQQQPKNVGSDSKQPPKKQQIPSKPCTQSPKKPSNQPTDKGPISPGKNLGPQGGGTNPATPSAGSQRTTLGVMRMDDPAQIKKTFRQLTRKKLQPRPQEPVRVNYFCHLSQPDRHFSVLDQHKLGRDIHPAFLRMGMELDEGMVVGSNRRCLEFLRATEALIDDFDWTDVPKLVGSPARAFHSHFDRHVTFLDQCRPLAVTVRSAVQFIKIALHRYDEVTEPKEIKEKMKESLVSFAKEQIQLSGQRIACLAANLVLPGSVVCVFGESSVVTEALRLAWHSQPHQFTVLVVDCRPRCDGQKMLTKLRHIGIACEVVHIAALPMIANKVTLTLLGAHSLLNNGYVIASMGAAHVANIVSKVARTPVMVCAETYKFWERAQSDAFEFNELGDPDEVWRGPRGTADDWRVPRHPEKVMADSEEWRNRKNLRLLNLTYDVIPPELVSGVITELGKIPLTSVPVVLRVKQANLEASDDFYAPF